MIAKDHMLTFKKFPCKNLSAITLRLRRDDRDGSDRGAIVHIAAQFRLIAPVMATR